VQATLDTLIRERPAATGAAEMAPVDVDDIALLHLRTKDGVLGVVEVSRMGTGLTNDLSFEIFGELGAIRFNAVDPIGWRSTTCATPTGRPAGMRGFRKVETVSRYDGQKAPDWSMTPDFVRTHAECQYQFLKAVAEGRPDSPNVADGLHIQAVMAAAERAAVEGRWVTVGEVLG
jgi:predicted dehydrogenase